ncbi:hypothetical protein AB0D67_10840 [Streptosporangium sp. NPDC048047]|uniref:hypothetical protein n=1 Tax=Streptosporangium sp. NPDC048047 TaxID=3155748 RepID=UPI00342D915C
MSKMPNASLTAFSSTNDEMILAIRYHPSIVWFLNGLLEAEPYRHVVRGAGIQIVRHALDLVLPPAGLLSAVERLAGSIAHEAPAGFDLRAEVSPRRTWRPSQK